MLALVFKQLEDGFLEDPQLELCGSSADEHIDLLVPVSGRESDALPARPHPIEVRLRDPLGASSP